MQQQDRVIHDLRVRIVSDESPTRIGKDIRSLILRRIDTANPLSDQTKGRLISAISALDTASSTRGAELTRSRLSSALLHLQLSLTDRALPGRESGYPDEILGALSREMLRDAARKLAS